MRRLAVVLAIAVIAATIAPAEAVSAAGGELEVTVPSQSADTLAALPLERIPVPPGTPITEVSGSIGVSSSIAIVYEGSTTGVAGPIIEPDLTVGFGWYVYVYLSRSDFIYLAGLSLAGASAALCSWLTPWFAGAIACAMAAFVVAEYIIGSIAPPSGYCQEFRYSYGSTFPNRVRNVQRGC